MTIISNIIGGLGNQMFQYATGYALAHRLGCQHELDVRSFRHYKPHQGFELQYVFKCNCNISKPSTIDNLTGWAYKVLRERSRCCLADRLLTPSSLIWEPHFHYWQGIRELTDNHYLAGHWQSEKYFNDIEELIRREFSFQHPLSGKNGEIGELMRKHPSISVHIRRGDYITNPKANRFHGVCSIEYYKKAFEYLANQLENPLFFVFSDDIHWAKENIAIPGKSIYIAHNHGNDSHYDMQLMSHCQHHVIANSSFSWWGAWLSQYSDKIVISPKKWFIGGNNNTNDLLPDNWIKI